MTRDDFQYELNQERKARKFLVGLLLIGIVFSIIIGELTFYSLYNNVVKPKNDGTGDDILAEDIQQKENIQFKPIEKVVYRFRGNIYIYDPSEKREIQLTSDASDAILYTSYAWKNRDELSFSKCLDNKCYVQTYNLKERKTTDGFELQMDNIDALRWSHKGDLIAILSTSGRKQFLNVRIQEEFHELWLSSKVHDVSYDYDDALYLRFSPSDERLMLVNTFAFEGAPSITILDMQGGEISSLKKTSNATPTFGFFGSEDTIYFKRGGYLYVRSLSSGDEALVTERIVDAFNFQLSPDRTVIAYWTQDWQSGVSTIWTYEIGTGKISRLKDQAAYPMWLNDEELVYSYINNCSQCAKDSLEFTGLYTHDLASRKETLISEYEDFLNTLVDNL